MALRGPHFCVGLGKSVGEMIFRYLQARCQSAGGTITLADLDEAKAHFINTFPNAFDFFEMVNQSCMQASSATAPDAFGRDYILAHMLLTCGQKPARRAFDMQVGRFGATWLNQFFGGLAQFVRNRVADADDRLVKAYAMAAIRFGTKLTISDLVRNETFQPVLRECLSPLIDSPIDQAGPLSDQVSIYIATQRGIPKPDVSKVTEQQMRNFLGWFPPQAALTLTGSVST